MKTNHCRRLVRELVAAAEAVRRHPPVEGRRERLARSLVSAFVPATKIAGVDVRRWLARGKIEETSPHRAYPETVHGFRPKLVAGGQGGEVVRHVAAAAAAVLQGRAVLVLVAIAVDAAQVLVRGKIREARAEMADDRAGAAVGHLLVRYLEEETSRAELTRRLRALLCEQK